MAEQVLSHQFPFVMCNFAPPDMVGHTGKYPEAILGVEATDKAIGIIYEACKKAGYVLFITSDHGNAEKMVSETGEPHTAHTCAPGNLCISLILVPFIMTSTEYKFKPKVKGALCDVAPTILHVMGVSPPEEMTGQSLIQN